jgi:pimeloyl-ACP methyl ester carboxylesterase
MRRTTVVHNKISLAIHHLREPDAAPQPRHRSLLLLHGLGERSPAAVPAWVRSWPGPIAALDFTGHGVSTVPRGGGYTSEMLLGDADAAMAAIDPEGTGITVLGRGLGAYIGLQLAGARPTQVMGTVLCDGPGLAGGPTEPTSQSFFSLQADGSSPDPYALVELGRDLRPPDYATSFTRLAVTGSPLPQPITVAAVFRPAWLEAVAQEHGVARASIADSLASYASHVSAG